MSPTPAFILLIVFVILAYNLTAWGVLGQPHTISGVIQQAAIRQPLLVVPTVTLIMVALWCHWLLRWF